MTFIRHIIYVNATLFKCHDFSRTASIGGSLEFWQGTTLHRSISVSPWRGIFIQVLPFCEGNMTICSPEAGNVTRGYGGIFLPRDS